MVSMDGVPGEIMFPTLGELVQYLSDSLRKSKADPADWPDKAKDRIASLSDADLRRLIADLMQLRDHDAHEHL